MTVFTLSEQRDAKYTVQDAVLAARAVLGTTAMCMNAVSRLERTKKITLMELNHIQEQLVSDSLFYRM